MVSIMPVLCLLTLPSLQVSPGITSKWPLAFDSLLSICLWRNLNQTGTQEPFKRGKQDLTKPESHVGSALLGSPHLHHSGMHLCKYQARTCHMSSLAPSLGTKMYQQSLNLGIGADT